MKKKLAGILCTILFLFSFPCDCRGVLANEGETGGVESLTTPSAFLMEVSTGKTIFEKNADEKRAPASVTKVMTLLLIFDAIKNQKISLQDEVSVSEYAASMGGSQVFLEPGEVQTVETMIKCIAVASANDACVAMAEAVCGDEQEFVAEMNSRAEGLGMKNTHFVNCNGLDAEGHLTTARDIALMSRELITKYPEIESYCTIWMENITHETRKGTSEFGLTNTNKLIRHYEYATGLKTGSTSLAGFCVSATARKNDLSLIAVIMGAETGKVRVSEAIRLLNYGFGKCVLFRESEVKPLKRVRVKGGVSDSVQAEQEHPFAYVDVEGQDLSKIERKEQIKKTVRAPVKRGDVIGEIKYMIRGKEIGSVKVRASESIRKQTYLTALKSSVESFML